MRRLTLATALLGAAVLGTGTATAGDRDHGRFHDRLEHRDFHRELDHREAHRYPMTWRQHGRLHDHLEHDAFHDRLRHRSYHRWNRGHGHWGGGDWRHHRPHRRGFSIGGRGFYFRFGR